MLHFINNMDGNLLLFVQQHLRLPLLTPVFKFITDIGNDGLIWIIIASLLLLFRKTRMAGLAALFTLVICFIINNEILKNLVARPRPFELISQLQVLISKPADFSFPSGHTASSFAAAGAFYYYGNKKWGIMAFVLAGLIGFSRIYLGVHYPSDVLCGAFVGLLISFAVCRTMLFIRKQRQLKTISE